MRWIFITLVFGNLLLLAFYWQKQDRMGVATVTALDIPSESRQLQLVTELPAPLPELRERRVQNGRPVLCYVAGPFAEELDARHLLARSSALGFSGTISYLDVAGDQPMEYWVYVPPRASREESMRVLRELQTRKIDSYIITQGDLNEGVSIGLFRNRESAYGLQKRVEGFGVPVVVKEMNNSRREFWVQLKEVSQLSERMRERIQASDERIGWQLVECRN